MRSDTTSFSYNSSAASSQMDGTDNIQVTTVKNYAKDLLKSRIFLGRYIERRLCNALIGYRDVVLLSAAEVDLKKDLIDVQNKLLNIYSDRHWIGITDGQHIGYSGLLLWTEIDNQPFGPFWFQIKSLKFREDEVIVVVKCLRHISDSFLELEPILSGNSRKKITVSNAGKTEKVNTGDGLNETFTEIKETLKGALSIRNMKEFITFLCALVIAFFTGSTAFINFLGNFVLALIREMSYLIKNSTPMLLGFLDFLSKIVGGFYILMAMVFKPSSGPPPVDRRSIAYYDKNSSQSRRHTDRNYDDSGFD